jgi:hypothetical protein
VRKAVGQRVRRLPPSGETSRDCRADRERADRNAPAPRHRAPGHEESRRSSGLRAVPPGSSPSSARPSGGTGPDRRVASRQQRDERSADVAPRAATSIQLPIRPCRERQRHADRVPGARPGWSNSRNSRQTARKLRRSTVMDGNGLVTTWGPSVAQLVGNTRSARRCAILGSRSGPNQAARRPLVAAVAPFRRPPHSVIDCPEHRRCNPVLFPWMSDEVSHPLERPPSTVMGKPNAHVPTGDRTADTVHHHVDVVMSPRRARPSCTASPIVCRVARNLPAERSTHRIRTG